MFRKVFVRGCVTLIPLIVTVALLVWLFSTIEGVFGTAIKKLIGPQYYFDGLGILVGLILVIIVGAIMSTFVMQKLYSLGEKLVSRIPLVKSLYGAVRDLMSFFESNKTRQGQKVVMVTFGKLRLLGFVTREDFDDLPQGIAHANEVAVFLPLSYQIGGHLIFVPREAIKPVPMSVEAAMRFTVTAGMISKKELPKGSLHWPWKRRKTDRKKK